MIQAPLLATPKATFSADDLAYMVIACRLSHLEMCELGEEACEDRIVLPGFLSLLFMESFDPSSLVRLSADATDRDWQSDMERLWATGKMRLNPPSGKIRIAYHV